jgi:hypothetical protein
MAGGPRKRKTAILPNADGTFSIAIAFSRYRFAKHPRKAKWSLVVLNEEMEFEYEPIPGVRFRPRLIVRIEGRPKNSKNLQKHLVLHQIRKKNKPIW